VSNHNGSLNINFEIQKLKIHTHTHTQVFIYFPFIWLNDLKSKPKNYYFFIMSVFAAPWIAPAPLALC
jgi:hypothetical protein